MSAPRMKRLSKMSLRASADRKKFEGVEKPLRTFSLVTFFCKKRPLANASGYFFRSYLVPNCIDNANPHCTKCN